MPDEDQLPEELRPLVRRQALLLSNDRFDSDIERLVDVLEKTLGDKFKRPKPKPATASKPSKFSGMKGVLIGVVFAFLALLMIGIAVEVEDEPSVIADPIPPPTIPQSSNLKAIPEQIPTSPQAGNELQVLVVQQLLQALGYRPGTADGVMGAKTVSAIKQFQQSEGLAATGQIDDDLLDALDEAEPVGTAMPPPAVTNMTETWYDNYGFRVVVQQSGNQVNAKSFDPYSGMQVGVSSGTFNGNTMLYQWAAANGTSGSGVGTLQPDQRHMDLVITDAFSGMVVTNQLHRGHMAGQ
ncbi:MAG: hypothetical protein DRR42_21915 [Gammaproteobacteria bacterium]|nr:MAG: hypothetical protein DRR42_21915 [Gammaproteobacteria bacterium]